MMQDHLGPGTVVGYCTNVHAGSTYRQVLENLERDTLAVKKQISPTTPMGVGLWLGADTAGQLIDEKRIDQFSDWLCARGLLAFTLNGFPYNDFHQPVVKHRVYQPDWRDPRRLTYTINLITILAGLIRQKAENPVFALQNSGQTPEGSISTLPIGWGRYNQNDLELAIGQLRQVIDYLARLEARTGTLIHLDLEPEPGCILQRSQDVVDLFLHHLDSVADPARSRRYLRVCHDTCHAAVMFETQADAMHRYRQAGIRVGKVQISAAIVAPFDALEHLDKQAALHQLARFQEQRYLHQTVIQNAGSQADAVTKQFYEDLPAALAPCLLNGNPTGQWRVHFHVPLYLDQVGHLKTTNGDAIDCLRLCKAHPGPRHFEIETYAWNVLPEHLRASNLADGIAQEFRWLTGATADETLSDKSNTPCL